MCAQTRPRFVLSSERVLGEWSQKSCYLQGKKIPSTGESEEVCLSYVACPCEKNPVFVILNWLRGGLFYLI